MTIYYRVSDGRRDIELSPEQFEALAPHKRADLRVYIEDAPPVAPAGQIAVRTGVVVGETEAHLTYGLRPMTAAELEGADLAAEAPTLAAALAELQTQIAIDAAAFNAMTAADKFVVLRADRRVVLRVARYLLRQQLRAALP